LTILFIKPDFRENPRIITKAQLKLFNREL